jgi:hypothetical protein
MVGSVGWLVVRIAKSLVSVSGCSLPWLDEGSTTFLGSLRVQREIHMQSIIEQHILTHVCSLDARSVFFPVRNRYKASASCHRDERLIARRSKHVPCIRKSRRERLGLRARHPSDPRSTQSRPRSSKALGRSSPSLL